MWHPVSYSADLGEAPRAATLLDERLVLWRDAQGIARAMRDRCVHRGTALSLGKVEGGETKHICGCGLSNTQPFCNGTHKIARQEDPNKLYWYDQQGKGFETTDSFQGMRCPQE